MASFIPKQKRGRPENDDTRYRDLLEQPDVSTEEIEQIRQTLRAIARAVCEHIWHQEFY